jgi:hypothetical protein
VTAVQGQLPEAQRRALGRVAGARLRRLRESDTQQDKGDVRALQAGLGITSLL